MATLLSTFRLQCPLLNNNALKLSLPPYIFRTALRIRDPILRPNLLGGVFRLIFSALLSASVNPSSLLIYSGVGGRSEELYIFSSNTTITRRLYSSRGRLSSRIACPLPSWRVRHFRLTIRCGHAPPASPGFQLNFHSSSNAWAFAKFPEFYSVIIIIIGKGALSLRAPLPPPLLAKRPIMFGGLASDIDREGGGDSKGEYGGG
ncbi:hypothetical protein CDAR_51411 [Caerostris darwini]|uniref:Uncharacterized protein n=1 Tax=Caerostris darwini TaxID=1538125 RepID=A0AAV4U612_9ARAC|nr:hypothetical protein CDAR_51411 [Caerostris darwini]